MRARDFGGPGLDLAALHLDGRAARAAHQVVMVVFRAAPVHRFAGVGAQRVDDAGRRHLLQGAVHRGQPDTLTAPAQLVVQLLGRPKLVELVQQRRDRGALTGGAHARRRHSRPSAA